MNKKRIIIIGLIICFIFSLQAVTAGDTDLNKTDKLTSQTTTNTDSSHDVVKKSNEAVEKQEKNIKTSSTTKESSENFVKTNNLTFENEDNNIIKSSTTNENKENTVKTSNSKSNKNNNLLTTTNDIDTYTLPNSDEVLQDGEGTFTDLKNKIQDGGTINLDKNYTWTSPTDNSITSGISITKNTEIIGNNIVIDAKKNTRVFNIASTAKVTISGITFINGNMDSTGANGGSIYSAGTLTITNCTFINNVVTADGGAVYVEGYANISYTNFINNTASGRAGALRVGDNSIINTSKFINSIGGQWAGALSAGENIMVYNSIFINNTLTKESSSGGAINPRRDGVIKLISNCTFINNSAEQGGAIKTDKSAKIENSRFINNTATNGGAIYIGTLTLTNSDFINNIADDDGGAICSASGSSKIDVVNSNFTDNVASEGGAINGLTITITYSNFRNNIVKYDGGAIKSTTSLKITYSNFTNNIADDDGGAIYADRFVSTYSNFRNNVAAGKGGAVRSTYSAEISDNNFMNNVAVDGGAIYINNNTPTGATTILLTITNSTFSNNVANVGGAVYNLALGTSIGSSIFNNNTATSGEGGAIFAHGSGGSTDKRTNIYNSNFTNNRALMGGAISSGFSFTYITNCNLINNSADDGGAILVKNSNNYIRINSFINNTAKNYGGSVYVDNVVAVEITDSVFIGSYAGDGGAICNVNAATGLTIENDTFIKNKAIYNGGAVYYLVNKGTSNAKIFRDYNNFDNQAVPDGDDGRIKVRINDQYMITKCYFENNTDYPLDISISAPKDSSIITINLYSPKYGSESNVENSDILIFMNMTTNKETSNNKTYIFDKDHWDVSFFNEIQNFISINLVDLSLDTNYTATIKFSDKKHLYKEYTSKFYVSNSEFGDFELIQSYITNSTDLIINLNRTYTYNTLDKNHTTGCINISNNSVTINCNGFAIDAQGFCRIFNITGANVTLNNVVLLRGNATGRDNDGVFNGGAIYWSGVNGTLNKVRFENNYAENGTLYLDETALNNKIITCTFEENAVTGNGGAIDCYAPEMHLINTTFISNYASEYGAALCREETATGGHGENNIFIDNYAGIGGAALAWIKSENITITNYTFTHNGAGVSGGAIYVGLGSESCKIINCTFEENYVNDNEEGHGGAIEWYSTKGIVINSIFKFNSAYEGGAIFASNVSTDISINNSKFIGNEAFANGGAIALEASNVVLYNDYFINNTAVDFGGAVHVHGTGEGNLISHSIFDGNSAGTFGGAIDWRARAGSIIYSNITNNNATYGGGIYLAGDSMNSIISHVIFIGNNATINGGAIDCNASNMYLTNTSFISNWAGEYGAALCREANATGGHGESNNFTNNHAVISGAALAWMASDNIKIIDYIFINNTVGISGGAIYVSNESDNCSVINSTFIGNYIKDSDDYDEHYGHGGAIDWRGADGKIIESDFKYNHALKGGAIYVGSYYGITNITHSNFIGNNATMNGGAIDLNASSVVLDDTYFRGNVASKGGALYAGAGDSNKIHNSLFIDNIATEYGGAIDWLAKAGNITYSNFTNNSAENGGAIHFNGQSKNSFLEWVIFDGNTAINHGGAMDCDAENVTIYNITFKNNKADFGAALCREANAKGGSGKDNIFIANHAYTSGAGLGWISSVGITITNYTFINNTAGSSGAAIYVDKNSHNCKIIDSRFEGNHITNTTGGHGAAMYIAAENTTITNSNFTKNSAFYGGAIFVGSDSGNTHINESIFRENIANYDGGAIYLRASSANINTTKFYNNEAINGGAIYVAGTNNNNNNNNKIDLSLFDGNIAKEKGGAIDWAGSQGHIYRSNFTNNQAEYGGGLYLIGESTGGSVVSKSIFINNIATKNGGAIDSNATKMNLTHTQFISNYAQYGAALCREVGAKGGFGENNTFKENHAYISGAALAWMGVENIKIDNYTFINNTADKTGAVIYVGNGSDNCKVYNCYFEDNFVTNAITGRGGAIDWIGDNGTVINTTFKNCVATTGGAIYVSGLSNNMTILNSEFLLCKATSTAGGAIVIHGDNAFISSSNFTACASFEDGGAIAGLDSNNAKIIDSIFKYNSASGSRDLEGNYYGEGGAIYWESSNNLQILNSKFYNNEAKLSGGAISAINCNDSIVSNIFANDSTASRNGGSIAWLDSNNVTIEKSFFNESGSDYNGGSIYLTNVNDITVKDSNITRSWASWGYGGGIYVEGNITINNVIFTSTYAHQYEEGTAIYFKSGNSTVLNSKFSDAANAIFIANTTNKNTIVYLIGNNLTSLKPTKGVKYLTNDSVMGTYEIIDYAVWNEGILYLDGNKFDDVIFNNGSIETHTDTYVLENKTWIQGYNDEFIFFVYTNDTDNNTIISIKSITHNGNQIDGTLYNLTYNAIKLKLTVPGTYIIYANDTGLKDNHVHTGIISVRIRTSLEIITSDPIDGNITITAIITPEPVTNITDESSPYNYPAFDGNITYILVNERNETIAITNNITSWNLTDLAAKNYGLYVTYNGNDFYFNCTSQKDFTISLWKVWLNVTIENIVYGNNATAIITSNSNGTVKFRLGNSEYDIELGDDRKAELNITGLKPGNYTVGYVLLPNNYYGFAMNQTSFIVYKINTTITIAVINIRVGDIEKLNVTVNKNETAGINATGLVKVILNNGKKYLGELDDDGTARFEIYGLEQGTYNVDVEYLGDEFYNEQFSSSTTSLKKFIVADKDPVPINITILEPIYVGDTAQINVTVKSDITDGVTLTVDGKPAIYVSNNGGNFTFNVTGLGAGEHIAKASYTGDGNHLANDTNKTFTVFKLGSQINVTAIDTFVGSDAQINVTLTPGTTGRVVITVNEVNYTVNLDANSKGSLNITGLANGTYQVLVTYDGDDKFNSTTNNTVSFIVSKVNATGFTITVDDINYAQNANITINVPGDITGTIYLELNDTSHRNTTLKIDEGKVNWIVSGLAAGNYTVNAIYNGNDKYNINNTLSKTFKVNKIDPKIELIFNSVVYENATMQITLNENIRGEELNVTIDGVTYKATTSDGRVEIKTTKPLLNIKVYEIKVEYGGNENYTAKTSYFNGTPSKVTTYGLNITAHDITVKDNEIIIVEVPNNVHDVVIWVNGTEYRNTSFTNNKAIFNITHLDAGLYTVTTTVNDTNFEHRNYTAIFTVSPLNTVLDVRTHTVDIWNKEYINITIRDAKGDCVINATGNVTIRINNGVEHSVAIVDGIARFNTTDLIVGNNTVYVFYDSSRNYIGNSSLITFLVNQRTPVVDVTATNTTVGQPTNITINIPGNATGYVIITGNFTNNEIYVPNSNFTDGVAKINVTGLTNGTYNLHIKYYGLANDNYTTAEKDTTFTVSKLNTTIGIDALNSVLYGTDVPVVVTVDDGVEGTITIKLNETLIGTYAILNGKINITLSGLAANNYVIYAIYNGNNKYNINNTESKLLTVEPATPVITLDDITVNVGTQAIITVKINDTATGTLNLTVNNTNYTTTIVDGVATFNNINLLPVGNYPIIAKYFGDGNYTEVTSDTKHLTVNKIGDYLINITATDAIVGENSTITVNVPDVTGDVIIWVNGANQTVPIFNGQAILNITQNTAGRYEVNATLVNENYTNKTVFTTYWVSEAITPITIKNITGSNLVDEDAIINVLVPTGITNIVTIDIDGKTYYNDSDLTNLTKGIVGFIIHNINAGNKTFVVTYLGDNKYLPNSTVGNFTVFKHASIINVTAVGGNVGSDARINVTVTPGATGNVIINVGGTNYTVTLNTTSQASLIIKDLANGTYPVTVTYLGDNKFNSSTNFTTPFIISKSNATVNIADITGIYYGDDVFVNVNIPGATGNVTIKLNTTTIGTFAILNGNVNTTIHGLAAGNYIIYASYNGDSNYNANTTNKTFIVNRATPVLDIGYATVDALNNAKVIVRTNSTAHGVLNITVNGENYTATIVDGVATFTIDVLDVGKYDIIANYYNITNDNYTSNSVTLHDGLNVTKVTDYVMNVTATDALIGENSTITVNLPATDMNGTVAIYLNNIFVANATVSGNIATLKVNRTDVGRYNVTATLKDDSRFADRSVFANYYVYEVPRIDAPLVIAEIADKLVDETVDIVVRVPSEIAANVTLKIDDVTYNGDVSGETVTFRVTNLTYGNKTVVVSYAGNEKYLSNSTTRVFFVGKHASGINVTAVGGNVGSDARINVTVTPGATGNVIINVGGTNYTVTLDANAKAVLDIAGLGNGSYPVSVTYIGDNKFNSSTNYTDPFVMSKIPTTVDLNFSNIYALDDAIFNIKMDYSINGTVTLIVNDGLYDDKSYYVAIVDGEGSYIVNNLAKGIYNVKAVFTGDDKYEGSNSTVMPLIVHDVPTELTITIDYSSIFVGDEAVVNIVLNQSINAIVTVKVNGNNNTVGLVNGKGSFTLINLNEGIYKITAVFAGDDKYVQSISNNITLTVSKQNVTIGIDVTGHVYGEVVPVGINVTAVGGNVTVTLDGTILGTYAILDGKVNLNLTSLSVGTHTLNVTYNGDNRYNTCKNSTIFAITNATLTANVTALNVTVEDNARFIINVAEDFKGNVSIKVGDNELYNGTIKTIIETNKLLAGNYSATMVFYGDNNYNDLTIDNVNFTISRVTPTIDVTIGDVTYPKDAIANINIGNYANGTVNVTVRNEGFIKVFSGQVIGGVANINLTHLPGGNYEAKVEFFSDDNYNNNVTLVNEFTILPNNSLITIVNLKDIYKVGKDVEFYIITENSTGDLTIQLNGVLYNVNYDVTNKRYDICLENLNEGNYTITAVLASDRNYTGYTTSSSFKVIKNDLTINISDITDPIFVNSPVTFTANLNETVTGNIIFNINGMNYTVHVDNKNNATYQYTPTNNRTLIVIATFAGNYKYNSNVSAQKQFIVYKQDVHISISDITEVKYGDDVFVNVNVPGATGSVIITLNNTKIGEFAILNGNVNTTIHGLAAGNYIIYANYTGDNNYNMSTVNRTFEVARATPEITIDKAFTDANTAGKVIVHINETATGTMNITVNDKTYEAPINDGVAEFTIDVLPVGDYDITANYYALTDSNYTTGEKILTAGLHISKVADYVINVTATDTLVGENSTITVNVPGISGSVVIWVNGVNETVPIVDGQAILNLTQNVAGKYEVNATLVNENYTNKTVFTTYWVSESSTPITINNIAGSNLVDEYTIINVNVPVDISGIVTLSVNGKTYHNESTSPGIVAFKVPNSSAGNKTFVVTYLGDNKYMPNSTVGSFMVFKRESGINVTASGFVNGNASVNVTVTSGALGYVVVSVDGTNYTINLTAGQKRVNLTGLGAGEHSVVVTYTGDDKFNSSTNVTKFNIGSKSDASLDIGITGLEFVGDEGTITVTVNPGITSGVTLTVDGVSYPGTYNGNVFSFTIPGLGAGEHIVNVTYIGNDAFNATKNGTTFTVNKYDTPLTITTEISSEVPLGTDLEIKVTVPENLDGILRLKVNDVLYDNVSVDANIVTFNIPINKEGSNTLFAIYDGSDTYKANTSQIVPFTAIKNKMPSTITVNVDDITFGDVAYVKIKVIEGATGNVTITIGDEYNKTFGVTNGEMIIPIPGLSYGDKTINVTYNGDNNYLNNSNSTTFKVSSFTPSINLLVQNITYGNNETIIVFVNANGNVTIKLDGSELETKNLTNGKLEYTIENLNAGNYTVEVIYNGNNAGISSNSTSTKFEVSKANPNMRIEANDIILGDIETVIVYAEGNGKITIKLNDVSKGEFPLADKKVTYQISDLDVGTYTITAIYGDDNNYLDKTVTKTFKVLNPGGGSAGINIIDYGTGTVLVKVNDLTSGTVDIKLGTETYTKNIVNGEARVTLVDAKPGVHDVTITVKDSLGHEIGTVNTKVTIPKYLSPLDVHVDNIKVGNDENIEVKLPIHATGNITLEIDGKIYNKTIIDGTATFTIKDLTEGTKTVIVKYIGDNNYGANVTSTAFNVSKYDSLMKVDIENAKRGENVTINVKLPTDATGIVIIDVDDMGYSAKVTNGLATLIIPHMTNGKYNVLVSYYGDDKYGPISNSSTIVVDKPEPSFSIDDTGDGKLLIKLPEDANGDVIVTIDGKNYGTFALNKGACEVNIPELTDGNHTYNVSYSGDTNYASFTKTGTVNINKTKPVNNIDIPDLNNPSADGTVTITLPIDATGSITLKMGEQEYTFPVKDGLCVVKIPEGSGAYTLTYSGDSKYPSFTTSGTLNNNNNNPVPKTTLTLKTIKTLKKSAKKLVLKATLKIEGKAVKGKKVTFIFRGKKFKAKTNSKGVAKVTIKKAKLKKLLKKAKIGKKAVYKVKYGKLLVKKYMRIGTKVTLTVKKIKSVKRSAKKLKLRAKLKINYKIAKGKKVKFIFKGKKFTRKTNKKGIAKLTIKRPTLRKLLRKVKRGKKLTYKVKYGKKVRKVSIAVK